MNRFLFLLMFLFIGESCITPTESTGVKSSLIATVETKGYCRDVDIRDSLLVIAADENGYLAYTFHFDENNAFVIDSTLFEESESNMGTGYQAGEIILPDRYEYFIFADLNDAMFYVNFSDIDSLGRLPYPGSENRDYIRGFCIDERRDLDLIVYTLNRAEDGSSCFVSTRVLPYDAWFYEETGKIDLWFADFHSTVPFNMSAKNLAVGSGKLAVANSQLGVIVFEQQEDGLIADSIYTSYLIDGEGEVETIAIVDDLIIAGMSKDEGCEVTALDTEGNVQSSYRIAEGYSIQSIHFEGDLLALGCGTDGVLLYDYSAINKEFTEYGRLNAAYTYSVLIYDTNTVMAATRDGLQIFRLER